MKDVLKNPGRGSTYIMMTPTKYAIRDGFFAGYKSAQEWSTVNKPFTEAFVEGEARIPCFCIQKCYGR